MANKMVDDAARQALALNEAEARAAGMAAGTAPTTPLPPGAIDLATLKLDPEKHQHIWFLQIMNPVTREMVEAARAGMKLSHEIARDVAQKVEDGLYDDEKGQRVLMGRMQAEIDPVNFEINLAIARQEGPGCAKCGIHFLTPEAEELCPVSDEGFELVVPTPIPGTPEVVQQMSAGAKMIEEQQAAQALAREAAGMHEIHDGNPADLAPDVEWAIEHGVDANAGSWSMVMTEQAGELPEGCVPCRGWPEVPAYYKLNEEEGANAPVMDDPACGVAVEGAAPLGDDDREMVEEMCRDIGGEG